MAPVVLGALSAMISKLGEWLQQIPGMTSEIFVQKSTVLGTPKILCRINTAYFYDFATMLHYNALVTANVLF